MSFSVSVFGENPLIFWILGGGGGTTVVAGTAAAGVVAAAVVSTGGVSTAGGSCRRGSSMIHKDSIFKNLGRGSLCVIRPVDMLSGY